MIPHDWVEYIRVQRRRELLDRLWPVLVVAAVLAAMVFLVAGWWL